MKNPMVYGPAGKSKQVKNLGRLLKNWQRVKYFVVHKPVRGEYGLTSAAFDAHLKDGSIYYTPFASLYVLHGWLDRPVFRGLSVVWIDNETYEIGSPQYRAIPVTTANPYEHERLISPRTLARRGKIKYRSKRTPGGDVLRVAFPAGRRRKGSGELQAILHKNPASEVAQEIYRQLGAGRFAAFTGARRFVGGPDFLQFQIPLMRGVNKVRITLAGDDTYTLEFFRITATYSKLVDEVRGIYADQLADAFTSRTGLYTSFAKNPIQYAPPFDVARALLRDLGSYRAAIDYAERIIGHTTDREMERSYREAAEILRKESGLKNPGFPPSGPRMGDIVKYRGGLKRIGFIYPEHAWSKRTAQEAYGNVRLQDVNDSTTGHVKVPLSSVRFVRRDERENPRRPVLPRSEIARAAGADMAQRRARAAGRKRWTRADYNAAVREYNRVMGHNPGAWVLYWGRGNQKVFASKRAAYDYVEKHNLHNLMTALRPVKAPRRNPPGRGETQIYDRVLRIEAVKGPGHKCDAACRRAGHRYYHNYSRKEKAGVYGSADHKKIIIHE
jgi:hypothetical protein